MSVIDIKQKLVEKVKSDLIARSITANKELENKKEQIEEIVKESNSPEVIARMSEQLIGIIKDSADQMVVLDLDTMEPTLLAEIYYTCLISLAKIEVSSFFLKKLMNKLSTLDDGILNEHLMILAKKMGEID